MNAPDKPAEELCREMGRVRSQLDDDVEQFVENTRVLMNWRNYVRSAPWLCVGTAALAGYLLVPSKPRTVTLDPSQLAELVKERRLVLAQPPQTQPKASSVGGALGSMIAGVFIRTALTFATKRLEQFLTAPRGKSESSPAAR